MKKKTPATFGDRLINFHLPDAWHKLEQWQLRYVCYIMTRFDPVTAKTYIFVRLLGITVLRKQEDGWQRMEKGSVLCSFVASTVFPAHAGFYRASG